MSARDSRLAAGVDALLSGAGPLAYTDDTQMMIALAESLIRMGCVSGQDILSSLADNYDPARGYGHGMKLALAAFKAGRRAPAFSSWEDGSKGNGGAVRVVALACAYHDDAELLAALAEDAAGVTHAHPSARAGAVAHALALAHVLRWSDPERVDPSLVT
jgi:poly(ADP-ribose) glycohydrolase ARH3